MFDVECSALTTHIASPKYDLYKASIKEYPTKDPNKCTHHQKDSSQKSVRDECKKHLEKVKCLNTCYWTPTYLSKFEGGTCKESSTA